MATFSEKLALLITANSTQAVSELKKVGVAAESNLSKAETSGKGFQGALTGIGAVAAPVAAGLAVFGAIAVKSAIEGEAAHARLAVAIRNVGGATKDFQPQIDGVATKMAKLGFNQSEVETSVSRLIPATHSVSDALKLQGLAADIARGRGISLADATTSLIQVEQGRYKSLVQNGVLSKNQVAGFHDQNDALKALTATYGGNAVAFSHTLAGSFAVLGAETHNLAEKIGTDLAPALTSLVGGLSGGISGLESAGNFIGSLNTKVENAIPGMNQLAHVFGETSSASGILKDETKDLAKAQGDYVSAVKVYGKNSQEAITAQAALATAQQASAASAGVLTDAMNGAGDATSAVTTATQQLSAAQAKLNNDLSQDNFSALAGDRSALVDATERAAVVEHEVAAAQADAQLASDLLTGSVLTLADAYLILGQSAAQAAVSSFNNLSTAASSQFDATQKTAQASDQYNQALQNLTKTTSGSSSGGGGGGGATGSTKNLTAAYYDQQTKLQSVRDATQAVADTQYELSKANRDIQQSVEDLATAQQNYQDVLNGVSKHSGKAQDAKEARDRARDAAQTAGLNLNDAIRQLDADKKHHASSETIQRDEIAVRDARRNLHDATVAYNEAQRTLNGTLHGFAAGSPEVVQAQHNLRDAEDKVHDSLKTVRESTDAAHDAQIALGRSSDDLGGKLDTLQGKLGGVSTSHAGAQVDSFKTKLDAVKTAAVQFASSVGAEVTNATGSAVTGIEFEIQTLKNIIDQQPALAGAFDSILANLLRELAAQLPHPGAAPTYATGPFSHAFAEGGTVPGPRGAPLAATVHGGEFVISNRMLDNLRRGGGGQVVVNVTINNPTGNGREIADQLVPALRSGHRRKELAGLLS